MKKILILVLSLLLIALPTLAACNREKEPSDTSTPPSSSSGDSNEQGFPLAKKTFDKQTITILTRNKRFSQQFVPNEEFEGSAINVAVKTRNDYIEENYGLIIEMEETNTPGNDVATYITSDTCPYDLVCDSVYRMVPKVLENHYLSLNDLLELDRPWWDQSANNYLTLSDKIFFVAGDAIFTDDLFTACVLFNKDEYATRYEAQYGSLYDAVRNGTWTYEMMYELAKANGQPDETGAWMTPGAYYGIVTDGYTGATMLTNGSGTVTASKDSQGNITLNVGTERSISAFSKVYDMLMDGSASMFVEQLTSESKWSDITNQFITGHSLFYVTYLNSLLGVKDSDLNNKVNPGIVPIPKYDQTQDEYFCGVNAYQSDVLGIPVTNSENLEATCYLMELLGYYSSSDSIFGNQSVTASFYETTLKLQSVTDDNDSEMLDRITANRIYDLGGIFDWGGKLIGVYSSCMYSKANTLASTWDSIKGAVELAMQQTIDSYHESIV